LIFVSVLGLIGIGFMNFFVSFGLAFTIAILSRNIYIDKYKTILWCVKDYFLKYPKDFFFPPREARKETDIWPEEIKQSV
jgi:site-specific recombinase